MLKRILRILLAAFAILWTGAIAGYAYMMTMGDGEVVDELHAWFPPLQAMSGFFGLREYPEWETAAERRREVNANLKRLQERKSLAAWKDPILFDLEEKSIDLYSPTYMFVWEALTGLASLEVVYEHPDMDDRVTVDLSKELDELWVWSREVGLDTDLMNQWRNTYIFTTKTLLGVEKSYTKRLEVEYEEIDLDGATLYLDPYFQVEGDEWRRSLVWQEDDFDGISTSFVTAGCADEAPTVLIKEAFTYKKIPACLTYSTKKKYLVYFVDQVKRTYQGIFAYDAISAKEWLIYDSFPLFQRKRSTMYQSLMFYNPTEQFIQIVKATWDQDDFETLIQHYDIRAKRNSMWLRQVNGDQVEIENGYEKIILYYYKNNESTRSITFPGLRYKYFVMRSWRWKLVNQWTLYHLEQKARVAPHDDLWSAYRLDAWLHEDTVVVEDPFRHIVYKIGSLSNPASLDERNFGRFECKNTDIWIYGHLWDEKEFVYMGDNINLLWSWRDVPEVRIEDSEWIVYVVDQNVQWYIASTIESQERWTLAGDVAFDIVAYDGRGTEICRKSAEIEIVKREDWQEY